MKRLIASAILAAALVSGAGCHSGSSKSGGCTCSHEGSGACGCAHCKGGSSACTCPK